MSRSGYSYDIDNWGLIRWRGQVASSIRGKRGQEFLIALRDALDAMPDKVLIEGELQDETGAVCALGAVGAARGIDMSTIDVYDYNTLASTFGISEQLAREIEDINDSVMYANDGNVAAARWREMRAWVERQIKP